MRYLILFLISINCSASYIPKSQHADPPGIKVYGDSFKALCESDSGETCILIPADGKDNYDYDGSKWVLNQGRKDTADAVKSAENTALANRKAARVKVKAFDLSTIDDNNPLKAILKDVIDSL